VLDRRYGSFGTTRVPQSSAQKVFERRSTGSSTPVLAVVGGELHDAAIALAKRGKRTAGTRDRCGTTSSGGTASGSGTANVGDVERRDVNGLGNVIGE